MYIDLRLKLLSLHPNIIVNVENVLSLFSSPSTSSQKVRKCGGHKFLSQAIYLEQNQFDHYTHPCVPTAYACGYIHVYTSPSLSPSPSLPLPLSLPGGAVSAVY